MKHIEEAREAIRHLDKAIGAIERFEATSGNVSVDLLKDVRGLLVKIVEASDEV